MTLIVVSRPARTVERPLADTFWDSPLPPNATLHPNSAAIVAEVVRQSKIAQLVVNGAQARPAWVPTVATVPLGQALIPGVCNHDTIQTAIAAAGLPIPPDLVPTPDSDSAVIILQPDAPDGGFMWELQGFHWITPGVQWSCNSLSRMAQADITQTGHFVDWVTGPLSKTPGAEYSTWQSRAWGIQGSGLPYLPGVLTLADILRGRVDHALLIEVYDGGSGQHVWPAARSDGGALSGTAFLIAEGMWLRLPANVFIDPSWSLMTRLYAQAARDFGLLITDRTLSCLAVRAGLDCVGHIDDSHLVNFPFPLLQCLTPGSDALWHPTS